MGTTAIAVDALAGLSVARQHWAADGRTAAGTPGRVDRPAPRATAPRPASPDPTPAHCPASARDLLPLLDVAGLAVVLLDGAGRAASATPAVERLLGPDPERADVWRAALSLVADLRRGNAPDHTPPATTARSDVTTARSTYRLAVLVPRDGAGGGGAWGAVTIQRLPAAATDALVQAVRGLSGRERQVGRLLAEGHTTAQAAAALGISPHTARHHAERLYEKLGVRCRAELGRVLSTVDLAAGVADG
jgi:DNA-binding CsgD family transcriptional regulator